MKEDLRAQERAVGTLTRRIEGYRSDHPKLYDRMVREFRDMSGGGTGGPYRYGYTWTTVRHAYFRKWSDAMFLKVLDNLGES